jgi:hypothetical protein
MMKKKQKMKKENKGRMMRKVLEMRKWSQY